MKGRYLLVDGVRSDAPEGARATVLGEWTLWWHDETEARMPRTAADAGGPPPQGSESWRTLGGRLYLVVQAGTSFLTDFPQVPVVVDAGRQLVVDLDPQTEAEVAERAAEKVACYGAVPLPAGGAVRQVLAPAVAVRASHPVAEQLAAAVDAGRLRADVEYLANIYSRLSVHPGYQTAAAWAARLLKGSGYHVTTPLITVGSGRSANVVAEKPGSGPDPKLVYVTAHLDSVNHDGGSGAQAPGADDNASGSAGVLEIARLLAAHDNRHDLRLVLFGGEEQGLHGSTQLVAGLPQADRDRLIGVINMDMVGTRNGTGPASVMLEGAAVSVPVMNLLAECAQAHTGLRVTTSLNPFASDHVPFINAGLPAVLTIEGADSSNHAIHTGNDTAEKINDDLIRDIVAMNVVATARLCGIIPGDQPGAQPRRGQGSSPVVARALGVLDVFGVG